MARMTRRLPCPLTERELEDRRDKIASTVETEEQLEAQKRELTADLRDQLKEVRADRRKLARQIMTRSEDRDVEVAEHLDDKTFTVSWVRQDTLEVVEERAMTEDETARARQGTLPGVDKGKRGKRKPAAPGGPDQDVETTH